MKSKEEKNKIKNEWRKNNPEKLKAQRRRYRIKHREKRREEKRLYRLAHPEEIKKRSKQYYINNPEKIKIASLKKYGITLDEYKDMLTIQFSGCTLCGKTIIENGKLLAVDHDHNTGKVRGLLCTNCNIMLGLAKDNLELLKKAIKYLSQ